MKLAMGVPATTPPTNPNAWTVAPASSTIQARTNAAESPTHAKDGATLGWRETVVIALSA